jgi:hypothetical protein
MATPTFVAAGTAANVGSGNMGPLAAPAGIVSKDILVALVGQGDNVVPTVGGGLWTKKDDLTNGAAARGSLWWSRYTSGDAMPTITRAGGDTGGARIAAFRGCVETGDPFVAVGASQANAAISTANSTVAVPSMTPGAGDLVLMMGFAINNDTSQPLTFSGYTGSPTPTERVDSLANGGVQEVAYFIATFTSDGTATGARTATTTNLAGVSTVSIGMVYALRGADVVVTVPDSLSPAALNGPDAPPGFFEALLLPPDSPDTTVAVTPLSDSDSGTGSETSDVQATVPGSDSGAGAETGTVGVTLSDSDSGSGTDAQVSIVSPVSGSDSATGTDSGSVSATVPGSDTSTGTDTGTVSATASSSDSGTGSDAGTAAASVPASDSGTGTEGGVVTETGPGGEGGAGTEAGTVSATVPGADSGSGTDAGSVVDVTGGPTTITGSDSGTGTDVGTVVDLTVAEPPPTGGGGGDYGDETAIYGEPMRVLSDSDFAGAVEVGVIRDLTPAPERRRLRVILPRPRPAPAPEVFRALSDGDGAVGHDAQTPAVVTLPVAGDAGRGVDVGDMQDMSEGDAEEWQMLTLLGLV